MPERAVFERSRRELSLDVSLGVHILSVVEQSSLESRSKGCAKTPTLTVRQHQHASSANSAECSNHKKSPRGKDRESFRHTKLLELDSYLSKIQPE